MDTFDVVYSALANGCKFLTSLNGMKHMEKGLLSIVGWNLKEVYGKSLALRTEIVYKTCI